MDYLLQQRIYFFFVMTTNNQTPNTIQPSTIDWSDLARKKLFEEWLLKIQNKKNFTVQQMALASADASFRRYFRIQTELGQSLIVMDAPPDKENNAQFVKVNAILAKSDVLVPEILDWNQENGFLLLSDLGKSTLLDCIDKENPYNNLLYFKKAVADLIKIQLNASTQTLAVFDDHFIARELGLFPEWYLKANKGITLDNSQQDTLDKTFKLIAANNLASAQVFMHRDYMPRNLMPSLQSLDKPEIQMGILDFQDAVKGPITYDIASLMKDAFWSWEEDFVLEVTVRYWEQGRAAGLPVADDFGDFYRSVEWMGLQRHLKIAGIFSRLTIRDGKSKYLADVPRFIHYIRGTALRYRELFPLARLIDKIEGYENLSGFAYGRV